MTGAGPGDLAAVILAGGRGRRMGGAIKPLLPVGASTVLDAALAALRAAGVAEVALSVGVAVPAELIEAARSRGLVLVGDRLADRGPLGGLAAALAWSPRPALVCLAGDLPTVAPDVVALIAARIATCDAAVPRIAGEVEPLVAAYRTSCAAVVAARLAAGQPRARDLPAALAAAGLAVGFIDEAALRAVDPTLASFTNWNRPEDR